MVYKSWTRSALWKWRTSYGCGLCSILPQRKDHTHPIASLLPQIRELVGNHWLVPFSSADLVQFYKPQTWWLIDDCKWTRFELQFKPHPVPQIEYPARARLDSLVSCQPLWSITRRGSGQTPMTLHLIRSTRLNHFWLKKNFRPSQGCHSLVPAWNISVLSTELKILLCKLPKCL